MRIDIGGFSTALSLLGAGFVYVLVGWLFYRRGWELVMQRAAAEWETLAQAQERRITLLEQANRTALEEIDDLRKRNDALVQLNLALQTRNAEQQAVIMRMEGQRRQ